MTDLILILDMSASMSNLEKETIQAYNDFLDQQRKEGDKARVTTVVFNHRQKIIHDAMDLEELKGITQDDYQPQGYTALLDALGSTIARIDSMDEKSKKLFVIITDGEENASKEYSTKLIKSMVEGKKEMGWEFVFLGANIDSFTEGARMGIAADRIMNFEASDKGIVESFELMSSVVSDYRMNREIKLDK